MQDSQDFLNKAETAHFLRISLRTLDRFIEQGDGPEPIRLGRRVIFKRSKVIGWADRKAAKGAAK